MLHMHALPYKPCALFCSVPLAWGLKAKFELHSIAAYVAAEETWQA